MLANDIVK